MPHQEIVEDITGDCKEGYCTLREILKQTHEDVPDHDSRYGHCQNSGCPLKDRTLNSGLSDRTLEQIKCIEIFKWHESINWNEAIKLWVRRGHAKAFAEIYQDGMTHKELYTSVIYRIPMQLIK